MTNIGFIGAGNMASAMIHGLVHHDYNPEHIFVSNRSPQKCLDLQQSCGVQVAMSNAALVRECDVVVLAVKPQQHQAVIAEIRQVVLEKPVLLLSVAIAVSDQMVQRWVGHKVPFIRLMPNTPAHIGQGIIGAFANQEVSQDQRSYVQSVFEAMGKVYWLDHEADIDAIAAISGSGPAYLYRFMEAWMDAAVRRGFSEQTAEQLVVDTVDGALALLRDRKVSAQTLREQVTSPKGSTEAAIAVFDQHDMVAIFDQATKASVARIEALSQQMESDTCQNP